MNANPKQVPCLTSTEKVQKKEANSRQFWYKRNHFLETKSVGFNRRQKMVSFRFVRSVCIFGLILGYFFKRV